MNISGFFKYSALLNVYKTVITLSFFTDDIQPSVYLLFFIVKKEKKKDELIHKGNMEQFNLNKGQYSLSVKNCKL